MKKMKHINSKRNKVIHNRLTIFSYSLEDPRQRVGRTQEKILTSMKRRKFHVSESLRLISASHDSCRIESLAKLRSLELIMSLDCSCRII